MKNIRHILSILTTNRIYAPSRRIVNLMQEKTTRRVLWYQRGNQNPYIEEEQTKQWPNEKEQNDKQRSIKHTYKTKDRLTRTPLKTGDENRLKTKFFQFFFYQILTTFNKLKIMSEVAHDNLKWLTLWYITGYID